MDTPISAHLVFFVDPLYLSLSVTMPTSKEQEPARKSFYVNRREQGNHSPYRVQSPLFTLTAVSGNLFVPAGSSQSVPDGYWILLAPLRTGTHIVHSHGEAPSLDFTSDTTYKLTVG